MGRLAERLDGSAILGPGTIGTLGLSVPALLYSASTLPAPAGAIELRPGDPPAPSGRRRLTLVGPADRVELDFSIPAPEISGLPGLAAKVGEKVWMVHWPLTPDEWGALREATPDLIALSNARQLLREGEPLVRALAEIRDHVGARPLLWLPRVALPHRVALLVYLGADVLDTTESLWLASEGAFLDATFGVSPSGTDGPRPPCACASCREGPGGSLAGHAVWALADELERVRAAARTGSLRELVEIRLTSEPLMSELLRYADRWLGPLLEERAPVVGTRTRNYVLAESFRRAEVVRFRRRYLERYRPPPSKKVLLLVPCSKTKPYRHSPSHRRFVRSFEDLRGAERVHVVSVTSPLGVVPRELEDVYPCRHYDIPVTGEWSEPERTSVLEAVAHLHRTGQYSSVVYHLDPEEYAFLRGTTEERAVWSQTGDRGGSPENLASLRAHIEAALSDLPSVAGGPLTVVKEGLHEIAAFQFGRAAADLLFAPPVRLAGRPWFQRLTDGRRTDLATWREERGLFHLTVAGGLRMLPAHALEVVVEPGVELQGDLFGPGVVSADPLIRVGDAVLVTREAALVGVGEAVLPGRLMSDLHRGLAVKVRHRSHRTSSAPTVDS
ncbi:MAG: DUF5591 domain-containing protein [Thermoplasmata archaeon]